MACKYSRTPLIRRLVIRIANYPDRPGPSYKHFLTTSLYDRGGTANRKVAVSFPAGVIGIFSLTASNRNEYQEYILGVKAAGA